MIALLEDTVSEDKLIELEKLIENEASVEEIDTWLSQNAPNYIDHIAEVVDAVQEYLESDDMGEEEEFEVDEEEAEAEDDQTQSS